MSHRPERKEKDCLNCGTIVQGKYCQVCGQENTVPKETFWSMLRHFLEDITHFDGKFFITLKDLLFKPGFLSAEYTRGRRASYLHPVRMYVFTSAIFFLVFFSLRGAKDIVHFDENLPYTMPQRDSAIVKVRKKLEKDSTNINLIAKLRVLSDTSKPLRPSDLFAYQEEGFVVVGTIGGKYKNMKDYDSVQQALPKERKDGFWLRLWNKRAVSLNDKYKYDPTMSAQLITESILHKLPYLLFVSLPFFALILKLLYIRRKNFYYADHAIFSVHHYILSFILLLFIFLFDLIDKKTNWGIGNVLIVLTFFAWPVYLYAAMKRFYKQGWFKTFIKFLLQNILGLIVLIFLLIFFFLFSIFQL
jgi:Protein of unknown function (DUF3667)